MRLTDKVEGEYEYEDEVEGERTDDWITSTQIGDENRREGKTGEGNGEEEEWWRKIKWNLSGEL
ncbi:hypothetical protein TWF970_004013 [Orbilia oligospora]|uniref:Uncharacterized protein n=1 Tax=Orbilia oligospora TaxID=2813651 RepID=A0A7C8VB18_ORBOL|nr:hypothetical protein TWF970_004013 [Orbilia oligospora]